MVRPYRTDDLAAIVDIGNRAWRAIYAMFRAAYGDLLFSLVVPDEATEKGAQVAAHCQAHPRWVMVAEAEGSIVGFVTFSLDAHRRIGVIGNNAVDPACGLKGIGQQMYAAVLAYFREHGMLYAQVHTGMDDAHAPARRAYLRAGFDIAHQDVTYYQQL